MPTSPRRHTVALSVIRLLTAIPLLWCGRAWCGQPAASAGEPVKWMVRLTLDGQKVEGSPIRWDDEEVHLLGRDGRLWNFPPANAVDFQRTSSQFQPYPPSEFQAVLLRELGNEYEVSGTGHYLVAHPRGQGEKWAQRFEDQYRSFVHYFSVRGSAPTSPPFPLVGVVRRNHAEFVRQSAARGELPPKGVVGYYNVDSNRITLFDMDANADPVHWRENAAVLIHEATHQMAFNTGIHSRYALPPRWLAEGLAMLFETAGVHNSHDNPYQNDRINDKWLRTFQQVVMPNHRPELLLATVASDDLFNTNPGPAYAEAWALTFFLVENEPTKYVAYLKLTASRPPFTDYPKPARVKDFVGVFGSDWPMLDARFLRFIRELK